MKIKQYVRIEELAQASKTNEAAGAKVIGHWLAEAEEVRPSQTLSFMVDFDDCQEWGELAVELMEDAHDEDTAHELEQVRALQNWMVINNCDVLVTV